MTRLGDGLRACCAIALLAGLLVVPAAQAAIEPNDPYWRQSWSQYVMRMPEVWQRTTGSPDVIIGMVDTGVDPSLPDLQGALVPGWDFVANDAVPRDTAGHGTHVASVLAARGNNGIGIAGYCWGCRIMPVRITSTGNATPQQIAQGIYWAVDHGARIITVGFNSGTHDFDESSAMRYAHDKNVLVIASAGNAGTEALRYPAAYPGVLPVAATNDSDVLYFWSSRGRWVQLSAPGCQLVLDVSVGQGTLCGTSFTPAAVAGVAGLMLSLKPSLSADEIVQALVSTAVPVQGINGGRIDPVAALNAVAPQAAGSPPDGGAPAVVIPVAPQAVPVTRTLEFRRGVMRRRMTRDVRVGSGRLDVQLHTARAGECQISIVTPKRDYVLSLLPPGEPTLLSMSQEVKAGKHRVQIECDVGRWRAYTLEISSIAARTTTAKTS